MEAKVVRLRLSADRNPSAGSRKACASGRRGADIPQKEECEALWARCGVSEEVVIHSRMVAELARILGIYLNRAGLSLDLDLIVACGYLHELADTKPECAGAGRGMLDEAGCAAVAEIVAPRMDIRPEKGPPDEADLIFLADSLVRDDRLVAIEAQLNRLPQDFAGRPRALKLAVRDFKRAERIKESIAALLEAPFEQIIQRHARGIRAASLAGKRRIYLVSHGEARSREGMERVIPRWTSPLSDEGIKQARALEKKLRHARISSIYCSDFRCARETAEIIGKPHGLHPREREDLRDAAFDVLKRPKHGNAHLRYPDQCLEESEDILHCKPPGAESLLDYSFRAVAALYSMLQGSRGNILIVGNGLLNRILLSQALGRPLANCLEIDQADGCFNMIQYCDFTFDVIALNEICLPDLADNA